MSNNNIQIQPTLKHQKETPPKISPKAYEKFKRFVIRTERDNFDSLYIIPCAGEKGWLEVGDHSALFYYYNILKSRIKKPKFTYDIFNGYYNHYELGRISIHNLDNVLHSLETAGIKAKITHLDTSGHPTTSPSHITRIKLPTVYSDVEVEALVKTEMSRRKEALRVPRADDLLPDLYLDITNFASTLHRLTNRNFDKFSRASIGVTMLNQVDDIFRQYLEITTLASLLNGFKRTNKENYHETLTKILTRLQNIRKQLDNLRISIQMVYSYQYINVENCCIIQDILTSIQDRIIKTTKVISKKEQTYVKSES